MRAIQRLFGDEEFQLLVGLLIGMAACLLGAVLGALSLMSR